VPEKGTRQGDFTRRGWCEAKRIKAQVWSVSAGGVFSLPSRPFYSFCVASSLSRCSPHGGYNNVDALEHGREEPVAGGRIRVFCIVTAVQMNLCWCSGRLQMQSPARHARTVSPCRTHTAQLTLTHVEMFYVYVCLLCVMFICICVCLHGSVWAGGQKTCIATGADKCTL